MEEIVVIVVVVAVGSLLLVFVAVAVFLVELRVARVVRGDLVVEEVVEIVEESPERVLAALDELLVGEEPRVHSLVRLQVCEDLREVRRHAGCVSGLSNESSHCAAV